ncbi:hypothetical protein D7Z54_21895 [Salibacterium salarium]|uniref:YtxH-like protein n=1 Tax=Salibacterium salarium TaxID=284579 RepID=A0A3R9RAS2_9BACI|nr:hypothetical protein [Salibacterium salarium]RSL31163.1 hypothetical protein D7Z54_21895 [Salibacterium salarium]
MSVPNDYLKGAAVGFITSFTIGLFISPVDGNTARLKTVEKTKLFFNYPSKFVSAVRGRKQKLHEFGRGRLESLQREAASLKEEAELSAANDYYNKEKR